MGKVLITGGNGYIGKYLTEHFEKLGYDIIITTRNKGNERKYETRRMDLLDEKSISGVCKDIDIVIHTATMDERIIIGNERNTFLVNAYGTRQIYLDAIKHNVKKFIYLSTFHVYGKQSGNIDEKIVPTPVSDYGLSHYFAEQYLKQSSQNSGCEISILRLTNGIGVPMEGVNKWYLALNDFCKTAFEKGKIVMKSKGVALRDFVAIEDVTKAVECLANAKINKNNIINIFNISSQTTYSIREVAHLVARIYEERYHKVVDIKLPEVTESDIKEIKPLFISSKKIRELGWNSDVSLESVIHSIFTYLENK